MNFITKLFKYKEGYNVSGLTKELDALYITDYFRKNNENVVVLTSTLFEANNFYKMIQAYEDDVLFFPMDDFFTSVALAVSPDLKIKRLETIEKIKDNSKKHIIVTCLMGYLKYLPNRKTETTFNLSSSSKLSREEIIAKVEEFGYKRDSLVTTTGEYAVRGYILDIFPTQYEHPIRIEFFDDDIEAIKEFDEETQRTINTKNEIDIRRFNEVIDDDKESLMDYINNETLFYIDKSQILNSYANLSKDISDYKISKNIDNKEKFMFDIENIKFKKFFNIDTVNSYDDKNTIIYDSKSILNFNSNFELLKKYCDKEKEKNTIIFALSNDKQVKEIKSIFEDAFVTNEDHIINDKINIIKNNITKGFIFEKYIVIAPGDIDKTINKDTKYRNTIKIGRKIKTFSDLEKGDYIVHEMHGIGIYNGLKTLKKGEYKKDYIELEYQNKDKVYVPIENIDKLYKYTSHLGSAPKLSKLNSPTWAKKKTEARARIKDISNELLELYTKRSQTSGVGYKDFEDEALFGFDFPYTLTKDQERAIKEIDIDLKNPAPMDRLLCGDVGFGKTEVAFRAMFKTVMNGFQVAYLCPTTILSKQQYSNAIKRFRNYPVRIELLNRYISSKKANQIIKDLEDGKVDIIIGTHKLLNEKIKYKNLGLLVVDEEQRFGVMHKEKIKEIKNDINILTLSATPIPRTLKMAMSGLRGLSILDTPPIDRYPIQTYVIEENDMIIKDAIYKELSRSGQVYILINNIEELESFKTRLQKLVPEANIITGHGQMSSEEINDVMENFIEGNYNVLVCTTIIETGIDIPNVNTIIILDSDKFGLSQLYQIRGRVGRSDKIAYAYLMYNKSKILTETAMKRLESIKEFTELGSGYKIAMRDLAIRGAGDILGREQAGFIDAIGLDLYTKMMTEEIDKIEGKESIKEENKNTVLDVNSTIDSNYVSDENIKIEIHKLISTIHNKRDFTNVKNELIDRFGKFDNFMEEYMLERCTEGLIEELKIKTVIQLKNRITIVIPEEISNKLDGEKLFLESYNINPKFEISYKNKEIRISLNTLNLKKNYIYYIYEILDTVNEQVN